MGKGIATFIGVIVLIMAIGGGIYWFNVGTSGVKGQGDAYQQKNSAGNWVEKQKAFQRDYNSIKAMDDKIQVAYDAKKEKPEDQVASINYTGLVNNCISAVGSYNSLAQEYDAKDFKDASLPSEINGTDTQTDCKEDTK